MSAQHLRIDAPFGCPETYAVDGVTVTSIKLEQSSSLDVIGGILPATVPVTARAQLLALHFGLLKRKENAA